MKRVTCVTDISNTRIAAPPSTCATSVTLLYTEQSIKQQRQLTERPLRRTARSPVTLCEPVQMTHHDFMDWKSAVSQYTLKQLGEQRPYLQKIVTAAFCKGSEYTTYQTAFDQREDSVKVIKSNFNLADAFGERRKKPREVEIRKKKQKTSASQIFS
ncbi:hypothetical protein RRG08_042880 [Elysia crispata]|uniref:Uncharacterized protein n=1 Tax=Elysia crispata TaxID=231223 RepID=A0AAE0YVE0_9GAST|nr:hypothetical protein RRG08_042880 [Elysia crispata]